MIELPPLPSWDGLHPLIVHFPVALLLVAPLFVVAGALLAPRRGRPYLVAALVLMALGTLATFVAVATGEAAGSLAERGSRVDAVLEHHEELAEATRAFFSALTVVFAAILFVPRRLGPKLARGARLTLLGVFLASYGAGVVLLINTAHNGGRLVHELGVRALMPPAASPAEELEVTQTRGAPLETAAAPREL